MDTDMNALAKARQQNTNVKKNKVVDVFQNLPEHFKNLKCHQFVNYSTKSSSNICNEKSKLLNYFIEHGEFLLSIIKTLILLILLVI